MHESKIQLDDGSDYSSFSRGEWLINKTKVSTLISGPVPETDRCNKRFSSQCIFFFFQTYVFHKTYTLCLLCCSLIRRDVATMREEKREGGGVCNYTLLTKRLLFLNSPTVFVAALARWAHVYYHNARSLLSATWRGEYERQHAASWPAWLFED